MRGKHRGFCMLLAHKISRKKPRGSEGFFEYLEKAKCKFIIESRPSKSYAFGAQILCGESIG